MQLRPEVATEVDAALRVYEEVVEASNLARVSKDTYIEHANYFVRWLRGDFEPGARKR